MVHWGRLTLDVAIEPIYCALLGDAVALYREACHSLCVRDFPFLSLFPFLIGTARRVSVLVLETVPSRLLGWSGESCTNLGTLDMGEAWPGLGSGAVRLPWRQISLFQLPRSKRHRTSMTEDALLQQGTLEPGGGGLTSGTHAKRRIVEVDLRTKGAI